METIVIFGGTGYAGGHIAKEAAKRGYKVISYSRHTPAESLNGVEYRVGSITNPTIVDLAASEADVIVVALRAFDVDGRPLVEHMPQLIGAAIKNHARLGVVGGAGSLNVAEHGPRLVDTPDFKPEWKPEALAHADVLAALQGSPEQLDWFYQSPATIFGAWTPGEATGKYQTSADQLVTKADGSSEISGDDYALAFVDEIEKKAHRRARYGVGH